jgi:3-deoxy-D-manno-octulosonate 8-phosphate phosphatase (KDO 8-P phosphatase)
LNLNRVEQIFTELGGLFCIPFEEFQQRLGRIRAFIFDWDGVFNDGTKNENGSSSFGEIDAMGTNLLRLSHYLLHKRFPFVAVMSGAKNNISFQYGSREHVHEVYFNVKNKQLAFEHFLKLHELEAESVAFFFDDVLDLSLSELCGIRIMINRKGNPLLNNYIIKNNLADYVTAQPGGSFGLREACEMLMGIAGNYDTAVNLRSHFSPTYDSYFKARKNIPTAYYSWDGEAIVAAEV